MNPTPGESVRGLPPTVEDLPAPFFVSALPEEPVVVIEQRHSWINVDDPELWRNRELLYFLIWRDIKVRYKQTFLGAAWALLQPAFMMHHLLARLRPAGRSQRRHPLPALRAGGTRALDVFRQR